MPLVIDSDKRRNNQIVNTFQQQYEQRQREQVDAQRKAKEAVAPDAGRDTTNAQAQRGLELHSDVIIRRLLQLNPKLYFEPSRHDSRILGVYLLDPTVEHGKRFVCGMERGVSPEFTVRNTDEKGLFKSQTRGWRTVLSRLIRGRYISKERAEVLFGVPSRDSMFWQRYTT